MRRAVSAVLLCLLAALAAPPLRGDESAAADRRWQRVAGLCRAWTAAEYLHPGLWQSGRDWDAAFAAAAAAIDGAASTARYREVAAAMLAALGDPATEVAPEEPAAVPSAGAEPAAAPERPLLRELGDGVLLADLPSVPQARGIYAALVEAALAEKLPAAKGLILDLRFGEPNFWGAYAVDRSAPQLVPRAVPGPARRWIVHWGYAPRQGSSSGGYRSGLVTSDAAAYRPSGAGGAWRLVLLTDAHSELPEVALALQGAGLAKVVSEGAPPAHGGAERIVVDLGEGLRAWVRTGDLLFPGGPPPAADVVLTPEEAKDREAAVRAAQRLLAEPWPAPAASVQADAAPAAKRPAADYPEMRAPPLGMRLLAACRAWGVIHHFYPYLELIGDWDAAFLAALPAFAAAESEEAYARAVLELMAHVADGHTRVSGHPAIARLEGGPARPPVDVRLVEGRVAIVTVDPSVSDLRPGDVVLAVDGEPLAARMERLLPLATASTDVTRRVRTARQALGGPADSTAVLEVEGADGARRRVEVKRGTGWRPAPPAGKPWRRLTPRIGYVDLQWLEVRQVDAMLDELRDTSALVFDMRGYPNGTAWTLAPRLNRRGAEVAALFRRREISADSFGMADTGYYFAQPVPKTAEEDWIYQGETVMLIDERAISQAEHTGLFLEAASGTVFVGEPTAGANGDVTNFSLPGGIRISFTGHDVRHADGRQLQRLGLQPDVPAAPTLAGLRAGRDEVLERALAYLEEKLGSR